MKYTITGARSKDLARLPAIELAAARLLLVMRQYAMKTRIKGSPKGDADIMYVTSLRGQRSEC